MGILKNKVLTHESDTMSITIEPLINEEENLKMWVTTIKIKNVNQLKSAFSGGDFNSGIKERTSKMAKDNNAILAINGSAVNFTDKGIVVRDGKVYRSKTNSSAVFSPKPYTLKSPLSSITNGAQSLVLLL